MRKILFALTLLFCVCAVNAKTLIAYYSFTGNCKSIVTELQSQITADVLEIEPAEEGLDYEANGYELGSQLISAIKANPDSESSYPAIKAITTDFTQYSTVIIVTPLWWSQMAAPMQTFLFKNASALAGKNIGLIVSSWSSGISGVESDARRLLPDGKFMNQSLWINHSGLSKKKSLIEEWLKTVNYADISSETWKMTITCKGKAIEATMYDNATTRAIREKLPLTLSMLDLYGREMTYRFPDALPTDNARECGFEKGEIVYYPPMHSFVIMYAKDDEEFEMQKLGFITNTSDVDIMSGMGDTEMTFSVKEENNEEAINAVEAVSMDKSDCIYDLLGRKLTSSPKQGVYIEKGTKKAKRL